MKTKIKGVLAIVFALFMFSSLATKAQMPCPKIVNPTHCTFRVIVTEYVKNPQTGACDIRCSSNTINVPPGSSIPFPCTCTQPVCNRSIQVVAINGVPVTPPVTVDYFSGPQPLPANTCGATGVKYDTAMTSFVFF